MHILCRSGVISFVVAIMLLAGTVSGGEHTVASEEEANALYIEATQVCKDAQEAEKTDYQRAAALYQDVQKKLRVILEKHPDTQMGAQLADGQLRIGGYTAKDFETAVLLPMQQKAAAERDPFLCAFLIVERIDDPAVQMDVLNDVVRRRSEAGASEESLPLLEEMVNRLDTIVEAGGRVRILTDVADTYVRNGKPELAQKALGHALEIAGSRDDPSERAKMLYAIADAYAAAGSYDRAYAIAARMTNPAGKSIILVAIAGRYLKNAQRDDARRILDEAYQVTNEIKDNYKRAVAWCEIAERYAQCGDKKKAVEMLDGVQGWGQIIKLKEYKIAVMADLAARYAGIGESKKAVDTVQQAYAMVQAIKDRTLKVENSIKLADACRKAGNAAQAKQLLMYAYGEARLINDPFYRSAGIAEVVDRLSVSKEFDRATDMVKEIQEPFARVIAQMKIAREYAAAGNTEGAANLLHAALADVKNMRDQNARDSLLVDVTERLAEIGKWQEAFDTAAGIQGKPSRALALSRLGTACAKAGHAPQEQELAVLRRMMREAQ